MRNVATEVSRLVHSLGEMDNLAIKIASNDASQTAQEAVAKGSSALYDVIHKTAEDITDSQYPTHYRVTLCLNKIAQLLGRQPFPAPLNLKIASIVAVDEALSVMRNSGTDETQKYAEMQLSGREYLMEVLRGVI